MSEQQEIGLGVEDLMNALRIINTATERGAFKANELSFVGQVYDKFTTFVRAAQEEAKVEESKESVQKTQDKKSAE
jgi:hypothetical protein